MTGRQKTILALEDEPRNAALLRAILVPAGYRLTVVESLATARTWLALHRPDLIVLDVGLPDGNGLELARELRAAPATSRLPIIVTSARVLAADRDAAAEAGCDLFLDKPLRPTEFVEAVISQLDRVTADEI